MNIEEYADVLNLELEILRYPNQRNRYSAQFKRTETKDDPSDPCLTGTYGNGTSPAEAVQNYIDKIKGRLLVVNATGGNERRQYVVPQELTA